MIYELKEESTSQYEVPTDWDLIISYSLIDLSSSLSFDIWV